MIRNILAVSLTATLFAVGPKTPVCDSARPMRVTARHIEAGGIGYKQGYTTLEGFFSWNKLWKYNWMPFLDLRGHVFNDGKLAANAGLGVRYLDTRRVWGMSGYYDYRDTDKLHYNQVSLGLESLGAVWDFRLNGYLPVGKKTSHYYNNKFGRFKGHHMFVARKYEYAFKGANAEVGAHVDATKDIAFYFAGGPYYLNGRGQSVWGGNLRATVDFFDCLKLEGSTSYDHVFKWVGQGQVGLSVLFGGKKKVAPRGGHTCPDETLVRQRAVQRVDRMEIVPVDHHRKEFIAIDPATGMPYEFIFVDNTSSSNGTFESPYPTLLQAELASLPHNLFYVFQGDGTSKGMDAGITLQDFQQMFGSGNAHPLATTVGTVMIPRMTDQLPLITNLSGHVVTLANQNTISGFQIENGAAQGVRGGSINGLILQDNRCTATVQSHAVQLANVTGAIAIRNNSFIVNTPSESPLFNANGVLISNANGTITVQNNSFRNTGRVGSFLLTFTDAAGDIDVDHNVFVTDVAPADSLVNDFGMTLFSTNEIANISLTNNYFQNQGAFGTVMILQNASQHTINAKNNTYIAPIGFVYDTSMMFPPDPLTVYPIGLQILTAGTSTANLMIESNQCYYHEIAGMVIRSMDSSQITSSLLYNTIIPGTLVPLMQSTAATGAIVEVLYDSSQTSFIYGNTVGPSKSFGLAFGNISTGNSSVIFSHNFVTKAGQNVGATTYFGGGLGAVLEGPGNLTAKFVQNTLSQNLAEGGIFAMNLKVPMLFPGPNGTLCVEMTNNASDTGYTLYNPDITMMMTHPTIDLARGYQTNVGTINGVPASSSFIPPAPPPPTGFPFNMLPGGPINLVPAGSCP